MSFDNVHPVARTWWDGDRELIICPFCGEQDDLDGYDVAGADDGCLFCNNCHREICVDYPEPAP